MFQFLSDWYYRQYARGTYTLLESRGGLPVGLTPENRQARVRIGQLVWYLGKVAVADALAGSVNVTDDLDAIEAFVAAVRRIPGDCFDRSYEGRSLYAGEREMRRKGWRPPCSVWHVAVGLLKQALAIVRAGGTYELIYRPGATEMCACNPDRDDEPFLIRAAELTLRPIERTPNEPVPAC